MGPLAAPDDTDVDAPCVFPFRYDGILFYGCTNLTVAALEYIMCATEIDDDYNAVKLSWCNEFCHIQRNLRQIKSRNVRFEM